MKLLIKVRPGASRTRVGGDHDGALVVAVTAPATQGRATRAALDAVAEALGVRRGEVSLLTGATARTKLVDVRTAQLSDEALAERIAELKSA